MSRCVASQICQPFPWLRRRALEITFFADPRSRLTMTGSWTRFASRSSRFASRRARTRGDAPPRCTRAASMSRARFVATHPRFVATHPRFVATHPRFVATHPRFVATQPRFVATHPRFVAALPAVARLARLLRDRGPQRLEPLLHPHLVPALRRLVEPHTHELVRQVRLAGHDAAVVLVRVLVALAVALLLHQLRDRVAQLLRHGERAVLLDERLRAMPRDVARVRL